MDSPSCWNTDGREAEDRLDGAWSVDRLSHRNGRARRQLRDLPRALDDAPQIVARHDISVAEPREVRKRDGRACVAKCRTFLADRGHNSIAATGERVERHRVREAPLAVDMYK